MAVLPDRWIRAMALTSRLIEPYAERSEREGLISYGLSSYGYDCRLAPEYKIPVLGRGKCLDPKVMDAVSFRDYSGPDCLIPVNSFILGRSLEYFRIPRDVLVICQGKSTYARSGVIVNITPLEPEWEGHITIAMANAGPRPVKVYSGEGIAQLIFIRAENHCEASYSDRKGKYQAQKGIQVSRV